MTVFSAADRQNILAAVPGGNNEFYDLSPIAHPIQLHGWSSGSLILAYTFDPGANPYTLLLSGAAQVNSAWIPFHPIVSVFAASSGLQAVGTELSLPNADLIQVERVLASIVNDATGLPPAVSPNTVALFRPPSSFPANLSTTITPVPPGMTPTITAVNPSSIPANTNNTVTITGTNFDNTAAMSASNALNIVHISNVVVHSPTQITCIIEYSAHNDTFDLRVTTTNGGISAIVPADQLTVT